MHHKQQWPHSQDRKHYLDEECTGQLSTKKVLNGMHKFLLIPAWRKPQTFQLEILEFLPLAQVVGCVSVYVSGMEFNSPWMTHVNNSPLANNATITTFKLQKQTYLAITISSSSWSDACSGKFWPFTCSLKANNILQRIGKRSTPYTQKSCYMSREGGRSQTSMKSMMKDQGDSVHAVQKLGN